jgi:hypothetical protein
MKKIHWKNSVYSIKDRIVYFYYTQSSGLRHTIALDLDIWDLYKQYPIAVHSRSVECYYAYLTIDKETFYVHRLIVNCPKDLIVDNRRSNLRICTQSENGFNRELRVDNTSGITGVHWSVNHSKWHAQACKPNDKRYHLGYFKLKEDAIKAVIEFKQTYVPTSIEAIL